jgi:signal transduction histidine kinase
MDHVPAEIAFTDAEGRFLRINRRKAEALKRPATQILGQTAADLDLTEAISPKEIAARETLTPMESVDEEATATGTIWTETSYVPIPGPDGGLDTLVTIRRDVTETRLAERRLRQADKLRALGTLAGGVAHDFNNLLTAILGSLDLAARRLPDEARVRRYLENATLAAQKGAGLTQRLLGFSRQDESTLRVVDLRAALVQMDDLLARTLGGSVSVEWAIAADLWSAAVEPDQFELAILNLAINARDAMPEGGQIRILAENVTRSGDPAQELAAGDYVRVTVADNGVGMTPEVAARVLEPFFTTKPVGKGTGLGLSMVFGFAQRSGGGLEIKSAPGQGCAISIDLPRSRGLAAAPGAARAAVEVERAALRLANVLVVDDDAPVRAVTSGFLRELGHGVSEAEGGEAALKLLKTGTSPVDAAVVDFAMPGLNGVEFIVRARAQHGALPIVLVTGYADIDVIPDDVTVLRKPFDVQELSDAVRVACSAARLLG